MVVVVGHEGVVRAAIGQALADAGRPVHVVGPREAESGDLFQVVFDRAADVLVAVEDLAGDATADDADAGNLVDDAMRAARSPARPLLVWVTRRSEADPAVERLQRSGIPYVVLRAGVLVGEEDVPRPAEDGRNSRPSSVVWIPRDLPVPADGLSTAESLGCAVADAVAEDEWVGRIVPVTFEGPQAWVEVVRDLGVQAEVVHPLRARIGRWIGRAVFRPRSEPRAAAA